MNVDKIVIGKTGNADTRSAEELVTKDELLINSIKHIDHVREAMAWMCKFLRCVAYRHDHTKLSNIDEFHDDFKKVQLSVPSGNTLDFIQMHWYKDIHLTERHHLNNRCPEDVNLFDVMERVADICMAGLSRSGKIYRDKLNSEILELAYENTIKLIKEHTVVL